jgi:hypothetical protein
MLFSSIDDRNCSLAFNEFACLRRFLQANWLAKSRAYFFFRASSPTVVHAGFGRGDGEMTSAPVFTSQRA